MKKRIKEMINYLAPNRTAGRSSMTTWLFVLWIGGSMCFLSGCAPKGDSTKNSGAVTDSLEETPSNSILEKLKGWLAYSIPDTMMVSREYRVGMQISSDTSRVGLENMIASYPVFSENEEEVQSELIRIGEVMRAVLVDPSPDTDKKFVITPFGQSDRRRINLRDGEPAVWEWVVTPLRKGDHKLYFSIEVIVEDEAGQTPKVIPVKEADIQVVVTPGFFQRYLWLLLLTLASLLAGGAFFLFRKRKQAVEEILQLPLETIQTLIGDSRLLEAVDTLHNAFERRQGKTYREVTLLKARLESCEEKSRKGILDNDEITRERNQITDDLLALLERIGK